MDLETIVFQLLRELGIKAGQIVLDFGCGFGTYTIPAAKIIGEKGKIYALDKDPEALDKLMQKAQSAGLSNIERIDTHGGSKLKLAYNFFDVILLFDVFHPYYSPHPEERRKLLNEVKHISKANASILAYPKHMELTAKEEIEKVNFYLKSEFQGTLVHIGKDVEQDKVPIFGKG